ncbi:MAG: cupredoxin family protein [Betaproteobacteria bacterium]
MKQLIIACATALSVAATGAFAHGDEHKATAEKEHREGHADALGKPGDPRKISRTIAVEMSDAMRFSPAQIKVKRGETIKFVVKNTGKVKHEMVLGSIDELKEHAALMQKFPEMEHADPNMVSVASGQTGELIWKFTKAGSFDFACLQPGHFEAGMVGTIAVKR